MEASTYEPVHTITNWYDGARAGIADFAGQPHYYQCELDYGPDEDYLLSPLDEETFELALEDWEIWLRWEAAFQAGLTTSETHPALPESRIRHEKLTSLLTKKLAINPASKIRAKAYFLYGENPLVRWVIK
jgi:hypothetical protein